MLTLIVTTEFATRESALAILAGSAQTALFPQFHQITSFLMFVLLTAITEELATIGFADASLGLVDLPAKLPQSEPTEHALITATQRFNLENALRSEK